MKFVTKVEYISVSLSLERIVKFVTKVEYISVSVSRANCEICDKS